MKISKNRKKTTRKALKSKNTKKNTKKSKVSGKITKRKRRKRRMRKGSKLKGEKLCRIALEKHFQKPFPKIRPKFLINPLTNRCLELDCFNQELSLALEYNGIQHYKYPNVFHRSKKAFVSLQYRDGLKEELCKKEGVKLITVPYTVKYWNIPDYVEEQIRNIFY